MSPKPNPARVAAQRSRRARAIGAPLWCVLCPPNNPVTDPNALIAVRRDRIPAGLLEDHHVVGRRHDEALTVAVCRNHHALLHIAYADAGVELTAQPSTLHVLLNVLVALGVFFRALAAAFDTWRTPLETQIATLDAHHPGWQAAVEVES